MSEDKPHGSGLHTDSDIDKRMKYKEIIPSKKPKTKITAVKQGQREVKIHGSKQ